MGTSSGVEVAVEMLAAMLCGIHAFSNWAGQISGVHSRRKQASPLVRSHSSADEKTCCGEGVRSSGKRKREPRMTALAAAAPAQKRSVPRSVELLRNADRESSMDIIDNNSKESVFSVACGRGKWYAFY